MNKIADFFGSIFSRFGVSYFFGLPADTITFWFLLAATTAFTLYVIIYYIWLRKLSKKNKPYFAYAKTFFWYNLSIALIGLVHLFGRFESVALISWRIWMYLVLAAAVAFNGWFFVKRKQDLEDELEVFANTKRKEKWLTKKK